MKKIRIVQLGIGHDHANPTIGSLLRQSDIFEVVGYCLGEGEEHHQTEKTPAIYGNKPLLTIEQAFNSNIDAVAVESDDWNLTRYAQMALDAGFPVHMDKPGGLDQGEFEQMARTAKKKKLAFQTGYMYRYNPMISRTIEEAKAGVYGDIYCVETHMDCIHPADKRQWLAHFPGGMLYFIGCHLIDLIVQIQGVPQDIQPFSVATGLDGVTGQDFGMAMFRYERGWSFAKTSGCEPGGFMRRQMVVCGSKKTLELRPLEEHVPNSGGKQITRSRLCEIPSSKGWSDDGVRGCSEPLDRYDAMMADFAAMVRGEKENSVSLEYECQLHRIVLAACGEKIDYKAKIEL